MVFKGMVDDTTLNAIAALGGHVWTTTTAAPGLGAGGTGTTRFSINSSYRVPDAARMLLGQQPFADVTTFAVAQSMIAQFDIQGTNYKYQPQQVIATGGSAALSVGGNLLQPLEYYDTFIPVNGGETWDVGFTPLVANSGNFRVGNTFTWTDVRLPFPVIYSQVGAITALPTTPGNATTPQSYSINNARMLLEVDAIVGANGVVVAGQTADVAYTFSCTAWTPIQQFSFMGEPRGGILATSGVELEWLARRYQRLEFTTDRATVTANGYIDGTDTNAPSFTTAIRWI